MLKKRCSPMPNIFCERCRRIELCLVKVQKRIDYVKMLCCFIIFFDMIMKRSYAKILIQLQKDCNILVDNLYKHFVKQNLTFSKIPEDQNWKIPLICDMINLSSNISHIRAYSNLGVFFKPLPPPPHSQGAHRI